MFKQKQKKNKFRLVLLFILIISVSFLHSQPNKAKTRDIKRYIEISNQKDQFIQLMDMMLEQYIEMLDIVSTEAWNSIRTSIYDEIDDIIDLLVPVVDKYFTHEDIIELIKFYESPIGKKLNNVTPQMMGELYEVGSDWGEKLAENILNKLIELGY